jgi:hypothetical protein
VSEGLEFGDQSSGLCFGVNSTVEIVGTEIAVHRNDTDPERGYPPTTRALSFTKSPLTTPSPFIRAGLTSMVPSRGSYAPTEAANAIVIS